MTFSKNKPEKFFIDIATLKNGKLYIYVRWNITSFERDTLVGGKQTFYDYDESRIEWVLPRKFETIESLNEYFESIYDELLDWAKATTTSF